MAKLDGTDSIRVLYFGMRDYHRSLERQFTWLHQIWTPNYKNKSLFVIILPLEKQPLQVTVLGVEPLRDTVRRNKQS